MGTDGGNAREAGLKWELDEGSSHLEVARGARKGERWVNEAYGSPKVNLSLKLRKLWRFMRT